MKKEYFDALSDHLSEDKDEVDEDTTGDYKYQNPKTREIFTYRRRGVYRKGGTLLIYKGKA